MGALVYEIATSAGVSRVEEGGIIATGRQIVEAAARMSPADLSVILTALQRPGDDDLVLVTSAGSANDRLWSMMAEREWMIPRGNPYPDLPITAQAYVINPDFVPHVAAIAWVCFEGVRQGMSADEIIAFGEGKDDPRLAHTHEPWRFQSKG